jgi:hypothetical protein
MHTQAEHFLSGNIFLVNWPIGVRVMNKEHKMIYLTDKITIPSKTEERLLSSLVMIGVQKFC